MSVEFLSQLDVLLADWSVSVIAAPMSDAPHGSSKAARRGFAFDNPRSSARLPPIVGEAQQVKRTWNIA
jgi:hypothetical protein